MNRTKFIALTGALALACAIGLTAQAQSAGGGGGLPSGDQLFTMLDKQKQGYLTAADLKGTPFEQYTSAMDADQDGKITKPEFLAELQKLGPPPATPPGGGAPPAK